MSTGTIIRRQPAPDTTVKNKFELKESDEKRTTHNTKKVPGGEKLHSAPAGSRTPTPPNPTVARVYHHSKMMSILKLGIMCSSNLCAPQIYAEEWRISPSMPSVVQKALTRFTVHKELFQSRVEASGVEHVTPTDSRSTPGAFEAGAGCGYVKNSWILNFNRAKWRVVKREGAHQQTPGFAIARIYVEGTLAMAKPGVC
ncbi:hypothetical protein B0H11DRAFT_1919054 [Mycena galericulata]|nr:hypothetical protein B0H11DRAFT_1919054 [Mycena galericulata]